MRTLYVRRVPTPIYRALERRARERGSSVSAETIRLLGRALRADRRSEEHTSELQSRLHLVCRLLLEKKNSPPLEARGQVSVVAHRERLERVIGHVIQNAVEATPTDGHVVVQLVQYNYSAVITLAHTS